MEVEKNGWIDDGYEICYMIMVYSDIYKFENEHGEETDSIV